MSVQNIAACYFAGFFLSALLCFVVGVFLAVKNSLYATADFTD